MVVLTRIDRLCPDNQEDLRNVYRLKSMKQKVLLKTATDFLLENKWTMRQFTVMDLFHRYPHDSA